MERRPVKAVKRGTLHSILEELVCFFSFGYLEWVHGVCFGKQGEKMIHF